MQTTQLSFNHTEEPTGCCAVLVPVGTRDLAHLCSVLIGLGYPACHVMAYTGGAKPLAHGPNAASGDLTSGCQGSSWVGKFGGKGAMAIIQPPSPCCECPKPQAPHSWSELGHVVTPSPAGPGHSLSPFCGSSPFPL